MRLSGGSPSAMTHRTIMAAEVHRMVNQSVFLCLHCPQKLPGMSICCDHLPAFAFSPSSTRRRGTDFRFA
jgi:hypothetical protein